MKRSHDAITLTRKAPTPLRNMGNTCYLNATVQLLRAWDVLPSVPWLRDPAATKIVVSKHASQFNGNQQHDAHEFLVACLDLITEKHKDDIEQGLLRSTVQCDTTGESSSVDEPFLVLSVAITHPTLEGCIHAEVQKTESLTGPNVWLSPASKKQQLTPRSSTKRIEVARWPSGVVIHLKRFRNNNTKHAQLVQCPFTWNQLHLRAIVMHHGVCNGGHYTCFIKASQQWYLCDDARVTAVPDAKVQQAVMHGYMLLYHR